MIQTQRAPVPPNLRYLQVTLLLLVAVSLGTGLMALLGSPQVFEMLGLPYLDNLFYRWLMAGLFFTLAVAYWLAYRDPVGNRAILYVAIVDVLTEAVGVAAYLVSTRAAAPVLWVGVVVLIGFGVVVGWYARKLARADAEQRDEKIA